MRRFAIPNLLAIAALVGAGMASGELTQQGNLRLAFNGSISPNKLPRDTPAPVTMQVSGAIRTADGGRPPELRKISIALNRYGRLSTLGLPTCDQAELEQTTTKSARWKLRRRPRRPRQVPGLRQLPRPRRCRGERAGARLQRERKRQARLLLHIYNSRPVQVTFVVPFTIRRLSRQGHSARSSPPGYRRSPPRTAT